MKTKGKILRNECASLYFGSIVSMHVTPSCAYVEKYLVPLTTIATGIWLTGCPLSHSILFKCSPSDVNPIVLKFPSGAPCITEIL